MVESIANKQINIIKDKINLPRIGADVKYSSHVYNFVNSIFTGNYGYKTEIFYDCEKNYKYNSSKQTKLCEFLIRPKDIDGNDISFSEGLNFLYEMKLHKEIDTILFDGAVKIAKDNNSFPFSFNLSMESIRDPEFWENIQQVMEEHGITPDMVVFEILEDHIENDMDFSHLKKYNDMGYRFAIDDFEPCIRDITRINVLSQYIDIEFVKLDGNVISNHDNDKEAEIYIGNVIDFVKNLLPETKIIAEYVSSIDHMFELRNIGVQFCQGHGLQDEFTSQADKEASILRKRIKELHDTVLESRSSLNMINRCIRNTNSVTI